MIITVKYTKASVKLKPEERGAMGENWTSARCILNVEKDLAQAIAHQKRNHAQPKDEKNKFHSPEKSPSSHKNNGASFCQ